jgi:hypothetical protein
MSQGSNSGWVAMLHDEISVQAALVMGQGDRCEYFEFVLTCPASILHPLGSAASALDAEQLYAWILDINGHHD